MERIKNAVLSKPVCIFFLIAAIVYGNGILYCFGNDPWSPVGTLSILCEDRKILYWIWALFVGGGYYINTLYAYRKYDEKSKLLRALCLFALLAVCGVGLSLKHDINSWNPKRIVHWISTGAYMASVALSLFLFFIKNRKRYRGFTVLAVLVLSLALGIAVWLCFLGKSGYMEMIPNTSLEIILLILNFCVPVLYKQGAEGDGR